MKEGLPAPCCSSQPPSKEGAAAQGSCEMRVVISLFGNTNLCDLQIGSLPLPPPSPPSLLTVLIKGLNKIHGYHLAVHGLIILSSLSAVLVPGMSSDSTMP